MISQHPCAPLCGGAAPDRCHRINFLLCVFGAVSCGLRGVDFAIPPCPVHRRPAAGQRGIPGASVPRFAFWHFGHR